VTGLFTTAFGFEAEMKERFVEKKWPSKTLSST
jgi:hypothetical protein